MPLDRGGFLSYSPDGKQIAYNRIFRNFRTWKRYDGGLRRRISISTISTPRKAHPRDRLGSGTETFPMWYGKTIYFLSDHDAHRRENIWAYDTGTHEFRQVTHYTDFDIDFPSFWNELAGDSSLAARSQQGTWRVLSSNKAASCTVLDIPSEQLHDLDVAVP